MMCSTVTTYALDGAAIVVARRTSMTLGAKALTSGEPGISVLRNTIPVFSGAGFMRRWTRSPVWSAIPLIAASLPIVFCISIIVSALGFKNLKNFYNLTPKPHDYQQTSIIFTLLDNDFCIFF